MGRRGAMRKLRQDCAGLKELNSALEWECSVLRLCCEAAGVPHKGFVAARRHRRAVRPSYSIGVCSSPAEILSSNVIGHLTLKLPGSAGNAGVVSHELRGLCREFAKHFLWPALNLLHSIFDASRFNAQLVESTLHMVSLRSALMLAVVVPLFACFSQEELVVAVGRSDVLATTWDSPSADPYMSFLRCLVLSTACFTIALLVAITVLVFMGSCEDAGCGRQVARCRVCVATSGCSLSEHGSQGLGAAPLQMALPIKRPRYVRPHP